MQSTIVGKRHSIEERTKFRPQISLETAQEEGARWATLQSYVRLQILDILREWDGYVYFSAIIYGVQGVKAGSVNYHLKRLRDDGYLMTKKDGVYSYYHLTVKGKQLLQYVPSPSREDS